MGEAKMEVWKKFVVTLEDREELKEPIAQLKQLGAVAMRKPGSPDIDLVFDVEYTDEELAALLTYLVKEGVLEIAFLEKGEVGFRYLYPDGSAELRFTVDLFYLKTTTP